MYSWLPLNQKIVLKLKGLLQNEKMSKCVFLGPKKVAVNSSAIVRRGTTIDNYNPDCTKN